MSKGKTIVKICPSCGELFESLESRNKKYCSQKCNSERNEKYMEYNCDLCGKPIKIKKDIYEEKMNGKRKGIYCSKECVNLSKRTGHDIACDNCGKTFYRRQYHIDRQSKKNQNNFCCRECEMEHKHKITHELRECSICGEKFEVSKLSTQRFCSYDCQVKWQTTRVKELHPQFTSVSVPCTYCGTNHYVKPYKLKEQTYFFCSKKCRQDWYSEIYSQTDEVKNRSRTVILQLLQSGQFGTDTLPQKTIDGVLDNLQEKYKREHPFEYFTVDNYLLDHNLIIEINGDYWHTNPIKFKSNITNVQYDRIGRDKAKHSYIKNQYDIEILYLWEYDIMHNLLMCEKLIREYIANKGVLANYHSFNYSIINNRLTLNDDLIIPYQDMPVEQYKEILCIAI